MKKDLTIKSLLYLNWFSLTMNIDNYVLKSNPMPSNSSLGLNTACNCMSAGKKCL